MDRTCNMYFTQPLPLGRLPELNQNNLQSQTLQQMVLTDQQKSQFLLNRTGARENLAFSNINQNPNSQYSNFVQLSNQLTQNMNNIHNSNQSDKIQTQNLIGRQNLENNIKQPQLFPADQIGNGIANNLTYYLLPPNQINQVRDQQLNLSNQLSLQQQQQQSQQQQQQLVQLQQLQQQQKLNYNSPAASVNFVNSSNKVFELQNNLLMDMASLQQNNKGQQQLIDVGSDYINKNQLLQQYSLNSNKFQSLTSITSPLTQQSLLSLPQTQTSDFQKSFNQQYNHLLSQNNLIQNLQQQINQTQNNQFSSPIFSNNAFINASCSNLNQNYYTQNQQVPSSIMLEENRNNINLLLNQNAQQIQSLSQISHSQQYQQMQQTNFNMKVENTLQNSLVNDSQSSPATKIAFNQINSSQSQHNIFNKLSINSAEDLSKNNSGNFVVKKQYGEDHIQTKKENDDFIQVKRLTEVSLPSTNAISEFDLREKSTSNESGQYLLSYNSCKMEEKEAKKSNESFLKNKLKVFENKEEVNSTTIQDQSTNNFIKNSLNEMEEELLSLSEPTREKQSCGQSKISELSNDTTQRNKKSSKKRRSQKDYSYSTLKKQKSDTSAIRSAFAKRNNQSISNSSNVQSDQKQDDAIVSQPITDQVNNPQHSQDCEEQINNQSVETESEQARYDELQSRKKEMQNESNYTKNILKGFRRYFIKNFYSNKKLMNNFEKYYSINSLNNEFILKLLTVSPYANYFKEFLLEDPEWWMDEAKISNKERQRQIFSLYQKQDISLIKTKRKNFNQKIICKLEKTSCKEKQENCEQQVIEEQEQKQSEGVVEEVTLDLNKQQLEEEQEKLQSQEQLHLQDQQQQQQQLQKSEEDQDQKQKQQVTTNQECENTIPAIPEDIPTESSL